MGARNSWLLHRQVRCGAGAAAMAGFVSLAAGDGAYRVWKWAYVEAALLDK